MSRTDDRTPLGDPTEPVDPTEPAGETGRTAPEGRLGRDYFKLFGASTVSNLGDGIGVIAYPWLASAVTRDPVLIALVFVVQRVPWLLFSLPAGVVTDRVDRRRLMITANLARTVVTVFVAVVVMFGQDGLLAPDELAAAVDWPTDTGLYLLILLATLLLGVAEVLYDNAAQTFMPAVVEPDQLEKANGRLWSAELVANTFVGPPLGALLIAATFALPFFVDAATFAVSAALIALIPAATRRSSDEIVDRKPWKTELAEGMRWLWGHDLLRPMAIILGILNALGMMGFAVLVLFAQEVLGTSATEFALLTTGGAIGGIIGGWTASKISVTIGSGPSLWLTLIVGGVSTMAIGLSSRWPAVWLMFAIFTLVGTLWNVITVSLRQTIIPDHLLGRVNSVYRFFAWGMMPIGTALGGLIVWMTDHLASRELALRMPWLVAGALHFVVFAYAAPRLTTAKIEAARSAGRPADPPSAGPASGSEV
jgi:MFS family permease